MERRGTHKKGKRKRGTYEKLTYVVVAIVSILGLGYLVYSLSRPPNPTFQYKAAIVDQLSHPDWNMSNPTFVNDCRAVLEPAGFSVDYYNWTDVTVDFYRNLPSYGYGFIVLRVHSAAGIIGGEQSLALFTSENYRDTKPWEQLWQEQMLDRVVMVSQFKGVGPFYFGVSPKFVKYSMKGNFAKTIIIMMGCDGLNTNTTEMAKAFVEKGAKVYIGWDRHVTVHHTDQATTRLLYHLFAENQTVQKAWEETMNEVGPDPAYNSRLDYYPEEAGDYAIPKAVASMTTNVAETINWAAPSSIKRKIFSLTKS